MGRKKKRVLKPWCWYCNRDFDEEKVLVYHQRSKHFRCKYCAKKMYTAPGLVIHSLQVHKEAITSVPNSLPHRSNIELEIYGINGIPEADVKARELTFIENLKKQMNQPKASGGTSFSGQSGNYSPHSDNSSVENSPNHYSVAHLLTEEVDLTTYNPHDDDKIKPPPDDDFLIPIPPVHTYPYASIFNKHERKFTTEYYAPTKKLQKTEKEDDGVKIVLSTKNFKSMRVVKERYRIVHPPYDVSLEEFRLSQKAYRLSITSADVMKSYLELGGIRPQTVAFGHLNPISSLNRPGILKNPPPAHNLFY